MKRHAKIDIIGEDTSDCKVGNPFMFDIAEEGGYKTLYYVIENIEPIDGGCRLTLKPATGGAS